MMLVQSALSKRGSQLAAAGQLAGKYKEILNDQYDPESNPDGFVNIGTAENVSCRFHSNNVLGCIEKGPENLKANAIDIVVYHA